MNGNQQVPADTSFSIHRTDLFPYIYLSKPIVKVAVTSCGPILFIAEQYSDRAMISSILFNDM
jgi:hypothetical protein